jgi:MFS family permease
MVHLFAKYGLRIIIIIAVLLAIISTAGYGIATGVLSWIFFRISWGLSFSAMRIGTLAYALRQPRPGFALGLSKSLQETGPMLTLFSAPLLLNYFHAKNIFVVLAMLSLPALYFAWKLPYNKDHTSAAGTKLFLQFPSTFNSITLLSAILIDGIMVVVLGILFLHYQENITLATATTLAAFYLGYRRICLVTLTPAGGWIGDTFGLDKVFNVSILLVVVGLLAIVSGWIAMGSVIVFTFYGINAAITPGTVSKNQPNTLVAVAENSTWKDIGAALGTLLGGILITSPYMMHILIITIFTLLILLLIHLGMAQRAIKFLYAWK